ncbi:MAG: FHA domain-containing protein [Bradymonadia bacterium]|jgi:pSer/pThr/pTyr-binding forkhead associated (FHA) protein
MSIDNKTHEQAALDLNNKSSLFNDISSSEMPLDIKSSDVIVPSTGSGFGGQQAVLEIEGGQDVFYRGSYVTRIALKGGALVIGRRDVIAGYYPDIDLMMYRKLDPAISRKHCQVYCDIHGKYFVEDLCNNNATYLNDYNTKLNHERRELKSGDRIFISMSISIVFKIVS